MKYLFSEEHFKTWSYCKTYPLSGVGSIYPDIHGLLDHGFIADRAVVWGGRFTHELEGHEIAFISRTYQPDSVIDNPPSGLRCIRLPKEVMGKDDLGTAIATIITGMTPHSNDLINQCMYLPIESFSCVIPLSMQNDGYGILIRGANHNLSAKLIKYGGS